jgi:TrmH family RNA methyltransferase
MFNKSTIKYIQSLQHKKLRDTHNLFIAEGPKLVNELLAAKYFECEGIYAVQAWIDVLPTGINKIFANKINAIADFDLQKLSSLTTANQVLGIFKKKNTASPEKLNGKITLLLDDIQDPGNFGTIIRIADWFAIENIICSLHTADMYNSKVVQSTMASLGRVNIFYTDIAAWLAKNKSIKKYAAALNGKPLLQFGKIKEGIIIIGNESKGISDAIMNLADEKITIPRLGEAESLNAAVATGIILHSLI